MYALVVAGVVEAEYPRLLLPNTARSCSLGSRGSIEPTRAVSGRVQRVLQDPGVWL